MPFFVASNTNTDPLSFTVIAGKQLFFRMSTSIFRCRYPPPIYVTIVAHLSSSFPTCCCSQTFSSPYYLSNAVLCHCCTLPNQTPLSYTSPYVSRDDIR